MSEANAQTMSFTRATPAAAFKTPNSTNDISGFKNTVTQIHAPDKAPNRRAPWFAPLASAAIPGAGQAIMGQQRSVAYVLAEGFLLLQARRTQRDASAARTEYRRLASEIARAGFGAARPDGNWDYYEILEEFSASGVFEFSPGGAFRPETDPDTYNGRQWRNARETYWTNPNIPPPESSPEYQRAVAQYRARAYSGSYRWSWRDHQLEQTAYIQTINDANRSKQRLVSVVGLVVANHVTSMIDGYINVRVRRYGGAGLASLTINSEIAPTPKTINGGYSAQIKASVALPGR